MGKKKTSAEIKRMARESLCARDAKDPRWTTLLTFFAMFTGITTEEAEKVIEGWAGYA